MDVLFLDFDGVLATHRSFTATGDWIDPVACALVRRLCEDFSLTIVISSSWRIVRSNDAMAALEANGLGPFVHATDPFTPILPGDPLRGEEIADWLSRNPAQSYIIIDDDSDMLDHQIHRLVHSSTYSGLSFDAYLRAEALCKGEMHENLEQPW